MIRQKSRAGLGASSVLLIIVILCLTAFGALMLVTARVDQNLTDRTEDALLAYYAADAKAQTALGELDAALSSGTPEKLGGWEKTDEGYAQSFPIKDGMTLEVLAVTEAGGCRVIRYRTKNEAAWSSETQGLTW